MSQDQEDIVPASSFPEALVGTAPAEIPGFEPISVAFHKQTNLTLFLSAFQKKHGRETMFGSSKSTENHVGQMFRFFPANLISSTYTDKNSPFLG